MWDDVGFSVPGYGTFGSTDYALTYELVGPSARIEILSAPEGSGWRTTLDETQTDALFDAESTSPQTVNWFARVTATGFTKVVARGSFQLTENPADQVDGSVSFARQMVEALRAALVKSTGSDIIAYTFAGRGVTRMTRGEAERQLAKWEYRLWCEQHPGQVGPAIAARFTGGGVR